MTIKLSKEMIFEASTKYENYLAGKRIPSKLLPYMQSVETRVSKMIKEVPSLEKNRSKLFDLVFNSDILHYREQVYSACIDFKLPAKLMTPRWAGEGWEV